MPRKIKKIKSIKSKSSKTQTQTQKHQKQSQKVIVNVNTSKRSSNRKQPTASANGAPVNKAPTFIFQMPSQSTNPAVNQVANPVVNQVANPVENPVDNELLRLVNENQEHIRNELRRRIEPERVPINVNVNPAPINIYNKKHENNVPVSNIETQTDQPKSTILNNIGSYLNNALLKSVEHGPKHNNALVNSMDTQTEYMPNALLNSIETQTEHIPNTLVNSIDTQTEYMPNTLVNSMDTQTETKNLNTNKITSENIINPYESVKNLVNENRLTKAFFNYKNAFYNLPNDEKKENILDVMKNQTEELKSNELLEKIQPVKDNDEWDDTGFNNEHIKFEKTQPIKTQPIKTEKVVVEVVKPEEEKTQEEKNTEVVEKEALDGNVDSIIVMIEKYIFEEKMYADQLKKDEPQKERWANKNMIKIYNLYRKNVMKINDEDISRTRISTMINAINKYNKSMLKSPPEPDIKNSSKLPLDLEQKPSLGFV